MVNFTHKSYTQEYVEWELKVLEANLAEGILSETDEIIAYKQFLQSVDTTKPFSEINAPDRPYDHTDL